MKCWQALIVALLCFSLVPDADASCELTGVNLSGAEFGGAIPGAPDHTFVWNRPKDAEYFLQKGMNFYRVPFLWERMQHTVGGDLDADNLKSLQSLVTFLTNNGSYVLIDPHNYGSGFDGKIGESATAIAIYADFWYRLALTFKSNPKVVFGLMNEPNGQNVTIWRSAAQAAIDAIRFAGATNIITVPGVDWTGAHSWASQNAAVMGEITDPINNFVYEVHQYLDVDSSGTHETCVSKTIGSQSLEFFTGWARNLKKKAILGEFGAGRDSLCGEALDDMLSYMDKNDDVWLGWTYWSAGPWWGNYFTSLTPNATGLDRPQMQYLAPHISKKTPVPAKFPTPTGKYTPPSKYAKETPVYNDGTLKAPYADYSWAKHQLKDTTVVQKGSKYSLSAILSAYGALWFKCEKCVEPKKYFSFDFWLNPGNATLGPVEFYLVNGTAKVSPPNGGGLSLYATPAIKENTWSKISFPLGWFHNHSYDGIQIAGNSAGAIPEIFLDDISFTAYDEKPATLL